MLTLYKDYSREEVHNIFSPESMFTPQAGTWGLQGIVSIPDRDGDYVFFVTYGQSQSGHQFDEYITKDGVLSWQSQPQQNLNSLIIKKLINHDEDKNSIYLFLRTKRDIDYTFLGKLKYLTHDNERENPVYFKWQILEWSVEDETINRMNLSLQENSVSKREEKVVSENKKLEGKLVVVRPPDGFTERLGTDTERFRRRYRIDYARRERNNRELGLLGELSVIDFEKGYLNSIGKRGLAEKIRHVSKVEGEGAGYDILSYFENGEKKYIEVKTTEGNADNDFYLTHNELLFSKMNSENYFLYRVFNFDKNTKTGEMFMLQGDMETKLNLIPILYKATR